MDCPHSARLASILTFGQEPNDECGDTPGRPALFLHVDGELDKDGVAIFGERNKLVLLTSRRQNRHTALSLTAHVRFSRSDGTRERSGGDGGG